MKNIELIPNETTINGFTFIKEYTNFNLWNYKGLYNISFPKRELPKDNKESVLNEQ